MRWLALQNKILQNKKLSAAFISVFIIVSGTALAALFDSQKLALVFCVTTIFVVVISLLVPETRRVALAFGLWGAFGVVFGLRSLQIFPIWLVIILSVILAAFGAFVWFAKHDAILLFLLSVEFVIVVLFSPAAFLMGSSLVMVWLAVMATLLEQARERALTTRRVIGYTVSGLMAAALFFLVFPWTL